MAEESGGLICAYVLDGKGGGRLVGWEEIRAWRPGAEEIWIHLDRVGNDSRHWLENDSGIDPNIVIGLLAEATRPDIYMFNNGISMNLRGINMNEGARPDDMVWVEMWAEPGRIVTTRHRHINAIQQARDLLDLEGRVGPRTIGDLIVDIADGLVRNISSAVESMESSIADLETAVVAERGQDRQQQLRHDPELPRLRRESIRIRRYLTPQLDVLSRFEVEPSLPFREVERSRLKVINDRLVRIVEDLDAIRDRAAVIQDEISRLLSERLERTMMMLSVVAAIFLPLGLLTGLLGINTGGIPAAEQWWGFPAVVVILVLFAIGELWLFRRIKWL